MKSDHVYLRHILDAIEKIERYSSVGKDTFMTTSHWHDATIRNLEIIGEAVKQLTDDFKKQNGKIPWREIAGFRDVLIHHYMGVDLNTVWNVIENDLPELKQVVINNLN